jgi:hypothetical protein
VGTELRAAGADPTRWPSLAGQLALAAELFGDNGFQRVTGWLSAEFERVHDTEFARTFSAHIRLPGVTEGDFNHRVVRSAGGTLLGGIRFYGRDITRPFVEIICHSFTDLDTLADCVSGEWAQFVPRWARLHDRPGVLRHPDMVLDQTTHAARCTDMRAPDPRVSLTPFPDAEDAVELVRRRYETLSADHPELARHLFAAAPVDLRNWDASGYLHAITVSGTAAGVLAVAPGRVRWIDGYEITEEVILTTHGGYGYAASAQAHWAHHKAGDPQALLVGTIDRLNAASRATARHAGRDAVLEAVFLGLPRPVSAE